MGNLYKCIPNTQPFEFAAAPKPDDRSATARPSHIFARVHIYKNFNFEHALLYECINLNFTSVDTVPHRMYIENARDLLCNICSHVAYVVRLSMCTGILYIYLRAYPFCVSVQVFPLCIHICYILKEVHIWVGIYAVLHYWYTTFISVCSIPVPHICGIPPRTHRIG